MNILLLKQHFLLLKRPGTTVKVFCSTSQYYMSLIDIIETLSTVLSINLSNTKKNIIGNARIVPRAAGCKARMLSIVLCTPSPPFNVVYKGLKSTLFSLHWCRVN